MAEVLVRPLASLSCIASKEQCPVFECPVCSRTREERHEHRYELGNRLAALRQKIEHRLHVEIDEIERLLRTFD